MSLHGRDVKDRVERRSTGCLARLSNPDTYVVGFERGDDVGVLTSPIMFLTGRDGVRSVATTRFRVSRPSLQGRHLLTILKRGDMTDVLRRTGGCPQGRDE